MSHAYSLQVRLATYNFLNSAMEKGRELRKLHTDVLVIAAPPAGGCSWPWPAKSVPALKHGA